MQHLTKDPLTTLCTLVRRLRSEGGYLPNAVVVSPEDFEALVEDSAHDELLRHPDPNLGVESALLVHLPGVGVFVDSDASEGVRFYEASLDSGRFKSTKTRTLLDLRTPIALYRNGALVHGDQALLADTLRKS